MESLKSKFYDKIFGDWQLVPVFFSKFEVKSEVNPLAGKIVD